MTDNKVNWNSNTPFPKLHNGKCPATLTYEMGGVCTGEKCRLKRKICPYTILRRDIVMGVHAVEALRREGISI